MSLAMGGKQTEYLVFLKCPSFLLAPELKINYGFASGGSGPLRSTTQQARRRSLQNKIMLHGKQRK